MRLDIPDRQTGSVEPDDLVIHPVDPGLALLHQFGLEAAVTVAGHGHRQFAVLALQHLRRRVIAPVRLAGRHILAFFIAQMRRQFGPQHSLHQPGPQLIHQTGIAEQVLGASDALQQFIKNFLGDRHTCFLSMKHGTDQSYTEDRTLSVALAATGRTEHEHIGALSTLIVPPMARASPHRHTRIRHVINVVMHMPYQADSANRAVKIGPNDDTKSFSPPSSPAKAFTSRPLLPSADQTPSPTAPASSTPAPTHPRIQMPVYR